MDHIFFLKFSFDDYEVSAYGDVVSYAIIANIVYAIDAIDYDGLVQKMTLKTTKGP